MVDYTPIIKIIYLFNVINISEEEGVIEVIYQCLPEKKFVFLTSETLHCLIFSSRLSHLCALLGKEVVLRMNESVTSMSSASMWYSYCNSWSTGTPNKVRPGLEWHDTTTWRSTSCSLNSSQFAPIPFFQGLNSEQQAASITPIGSLLHAGLLTQGSHRLFLIN